MKISSFQITPMNGFLMNLQNKNSKEMENHSKYFELEKGITRKMLIVSSNTK
jgi:hypothetical protein